MAAAVLGVSLGCRPAPVEPGAPVAASPVTDGASETPQIVEPTKRPERFVADLAAARFDDAAAGLRGAAAKQYDAAALREVWSSLQRRYGRYVGPGQVTVTTVRTSVRAEVRVQFESANAGFGMHVHRDGRISRLVTDTWEPPAFVDRTRFREVDVEIGAEPWRLPATVTVPVSGQAPAAVVLVHGSGPNDRDESVGPNKVFRDLAWGLGHSGIAVIRYEKRTRQHAAKLSDPDTFAALTVKHETVDDAVAAAAWLRGSDTVDPSRVFVVGHSLGAYLAPRIAAADGDLAGIVLIAGSARPLTELVREQVAYIAASDGEVTDAEKAGIARTDRAMTAIEDPKLAVEPREPGQRPKTYFGVPAGYWLDLRAYDAVATARKLDIPILVIQGGRDYQVPDKDYAQWRKGLKRRKHVEFRRYPALNHLMIAGTEPSVPAEYQTPGHVDETLVAELASWIRGHLGNPGIAHDRR